MGRHVRAVAMTVAAVFTLVGVFAPWLRSGASDRSSFDLFNLVDRLGFASGGVFAWTVRLWPLVPLLVVAAVVAQWARRTVTSGVIAVIVGLYVGAVAGGVSLAPDANLIRTQWGVPLAGVSGTALFGMGVWCLISSARGRARPSRS